MKKISKVERDFRINNLNLFNAKGFPNKKQEDWKFSDLREIVQKNFKKLNVNKVNSKVKKINLIKDFDHNYIVVVNGELKSSNFKFEDKNRVRIKNFKNDNFLQENKDNPLIYLNHALSDKGYDVEVEDNYKFKKALIVYNLFTKDLKENILNSRNKIKIGENSELHTIDLVVNDSKYKFMNNVYENVILDNFGQNVDEHLIYSLFNIIDQDNKYLIINSLIPVSKISFKLEDLRSRTKNCLVAKIDKPEDDLMFALILKNFSDRQITIDKKLIDFIIKRVDRSYGKIFEFIYKIDEISLKRKKSIDFKIIKEVLKA